MRSSRTLLLSLGYEPIGFIALRRALRLLTLGKVEVLEEYEDEVRTVSVIWKAPAVVRLLNKIPWRLPPVKFSRASVLARDGYQCQYCGEERSSEELTLDHVVPRAQGGRTCWTNIVIACVDCNARKSNRTPPEAGMKLRAKPYEPKWVPRFRHEISGRSVPEILRSYLYWMGELAT